MERDIVVLIPHYNNLEGLYNSVKSIKCDSSIDVLIVDDGSKIKPDLEHLQQFSAPNVFIHVLYNEKNQGIEHTLNNGLKYIQSTLKSKYVARLDCGDLCDDSRFIKQKEFLENNPDVYLIGSWVKFITETKQEVFTLKAPSEHSAIKNDMFLKCSFIHPSVMFRTAVLDSIGLYPVTYKAAEDYAFFFSIVKQHKTHILPEVLTYCELNPKGISLTTRSIQLKNRIRIIWENRALSPYFFLGLMRTSLIIITPYKMIEKAKMLLFR